MDIWWILVNIGEYLVDIGEYLVNIWWIFGGYLVDFHIDKDFLLTVARCFGGKEEVHGPLAARGRI